MIIKALLKRRIFEMRLNPREIGNRLFKVRWVAGYGEEGQQQDFATEAKVPEKSYSHWETGRVAVPVQHALNLCEFLPGLTLDYIYRGGMDYVPPELGRRLRKAPDRPPTRRGRRGKSSK